MALVVRFLDEHIRTRAVWEAELLYPVVDEQAGGGGDRVTSTMRHEHVITGSCSGHGHLVAIGSALVKRPGGRPRQWWGISIAVLCLVAWLGTGWHLAVEPHDSDLASPAVDHHDHDDDDHGHSDGEGHDAGDHLIPAVTWPLATGPVSLALAPPSASELWVPHVTTPRPFPPRSDRGPKTDPPSSTRRPRAPPAG